MTQENKIDPYEYGYTKGQECMIDTESILQMIDFFGRIVQENPPKVFAPMQYAETVEIHKNNKGKITSTETEWKDYSMEAFFASMSSPKGGVLGMSDIPFRALQFQRFLEMLHLRNIKSGVSKKVSKIQEQDALAKLS